MTILMLAHVIAPAGGIEAALVDLSRALQDAGHRVVVYACRPFEQPNQNVDRLRQTGAELANCPGWLSSLADVDEPARVAVCDGMLWIIVPLILPIVVLDALARRRSWRRSLDGLRGKARGWLVPRLQIERLYYVPLDLRLRRSRPDVVHVHGWGCGIDPPGGLRWARARRFAVAYTEHNSPPPLADDAAQPPSWLNLADIVIACSHAGARGLQQVCCAEKPIVVIPYSVADPTEIIGSSPSQVRDHRTVTITCLARLSTQQKGQHYLLQAARMVVDEHPRTRFLFAGNGESRAALEQLTRDLDLEGNVTFLGVVSRERLNWLMAESDIMVLPSLWEGLPVSIIESMAFGKPVVATNVGGNPELVSDGQSGLIVPARDPSALAIALERLVADPELRARMGTAARQRFESGHFDPGSVAAATCAAYEHAMQAHCRTHHQTT